MPFQKMTIDDIPVIAPYFRFVTTNTCDFTVGGMFMWRDYFHMAWQVKDGVLYSTLTGEDGNLYYNLPLGEDIPAGLRQCLARHPERPVRFCTIPEADLPKIFDRFYRVDKARSREVGGTGLGLSIVSDTVCRRGGTVSVAHRPAGQGTLFTVRLPQVTEEGGST